MELEQLISQSFSPGTKEDFTLRLTTNQIIDKYLDHTGKVLKHDEVYSVMSRLDFKCFTDESFDIHWHLIAK